MAQKPVLGKGLASLLPNAASVPPAPAVTPEVAEKPNWGAGAVSAGAALPVQEGVASKERLLAISTISPEEILINPFQPRREFDTSALEELAQSIRENGLIQPLVVRKLPSGKVELIAGERRLRASKLVGLKQVPIVVRRSTDRESLEIALVENIQRQDLNCIDESLAYFQLQQEFQLTQEEIAQRVGKDRATVSNFLRLLKLPEAIIEDLKKGKMSLGHGKALLGLEDHDSRLKARDQIIEGNLSVREAELLVERLKSMTPSTGDVASSAPAAAELSPIRARLQALSQDLARLWSAKVEIKGSARKGKIILHYASRQDLERILMSMQNQKPT